MFTPAHLRLPRRDRAILGGILVVLALAAWLARRVVTPTGAPPPPRLVQLTSLRGIASNPTFSPDGEQLAFAWRGEKQDNWDVYLKMVDSPELRRLTTHAAVDISPSWSPDGRQIAYLRLSPDQPPTGGLATIRLVSPLGGSDRKLMDFSTAGSWYGVAGPSWTPDGRWLAVTRFDSANKSLRGGIFLVPVQGGEPRALTSPQAEGESHVNAAFSPDGRRVVFLACLPFQCQLEVAELGPDSVPIGLPRRLTKGDFLPYSHPCWTRDGRSIVYASSADDMLWRVSAAGDRPPERIEVAGFHSIWPTTAASQDRLAFQRMLLGAADIYELETGRPPRPVLASSEADCCSSLSPDGQRVAFSSGRSSESGVWIADADFSNAMPLTHGLQGGAPRWSPDGRSIAFDSRDSDGRYHIWTIAADGGSPRQLTKGQGDENLPSWSRDGRHVYFAATRGASTDVWRIAAVGVGGAEERLTHDGGQGAHESIDGKTLFFKRGDITAGEAPLVALPLGGGAERQLVDCVGSFDVVASGLYYFGCRADEAGRPLYRLDLATGRSQLLEKLERATGRWLTVSSDGKTILYQRGRDDRGDLMMIENFR
jgi:Tol biopolymer transport system component